MQCDVSYSGIVEEDMVLSLQQTVPEKTVEKEKEEEELPVEQEDSSVMDMMKLFKKDQPTCLDSPDSLYEQLKDEPEALTVLAPAAGDSFISLDFNSPGYYSSSEQVPLCRYLY